MILTLKYQVLIASTYLWIGFVCSISFMEAWLKFRAPGVTLPVGLGIGRLVFNALNKMEWGFALVILLSLFSLQENLFRAINLTFYVSLFVLLLQTFWLLPSLDTRVQLHLDGKPVPSSFLHFYFVGAEIVKVAGLFLFGNGWVCLLLKK